MAERGLTRVFFAVARTDDAHCHVRNRPPRSAASCNPTLGGDAVLHCRTVLNAVERVERLSSWQNLDQQDRGGGSGCKGDLRLRSRAESGQVPVQIYPDSPDSSAMWTRMPIQVYPEKKRQ
eukprot:1670355-Rhodomonas_salina.2